MSTRRSAFLLLLALPLAGCYGDVESFAKAAAKQDCKRLEECRKDVLDEEYGGDVGRCRDDLENDLLDVFEGLDELGCDYVPDQGRECIKAARQNNKDCSEPADDAIVNACAEVFECPDLGLPTAPGLHSEPGLISDVIVP